MQYGVYDARYLLRALEAEVGGRDRGGDDAVYKNDGFCCLSFSNFVFRCSIFDWTLFYMSDMMLSIIARFTTKMVEYGRRKERELEQSALALFIASPRPSLSSCNRTLRPCVHDFYSLLSLFLFLLGVVSSLFLYTSLPLSLLSSSTLSLSHTHIHTQSLQLSLSLSLFHSRKGPGWPKGKQSESGATSQCPSCDWTLSPLASKLSADHVK